ncbi:PEP-CTERM/exosortase system-associated acyltransferase [Gammaproteobacteria bacterium]|nr:PEP-CTERM/exosortase system-associated acyltransferase [Gammaproteobacteria bacterium]
MLTTYGDYFETKLAQTPDLLEAAYRLRYQVYCLENAFEDPSEHPDGLETDSFDDHSVHSVLVHRETERIVGSVRLILPVLNGAATPLPIQSVYSRPLPFPQETTAEVSRLSVSKEVRRRMTDGIYPDEKPDFKNSGQVPGERRILPFIILGLVSGLVEMSGANGITHWCTIMMPSLSRLLARIGIHFYPFGPMVEYHGMRQPCYRNLDDLLCQVKQEKPEVWEVLTRQGTIWPPRQ